MAQERDLIRPAGAARRAGVSEATIRRWVREEKLRKYVDGLGRTWVDGNQVDALVTPQPDPVPVTGVGA